MNSKRKQSIVRKLVILVNPVIYLGHKKGKFLKMLENGDSERSHFQGGQKWLLRKGPLDPGEHYEKKFLQDRQFLTILRPYICTFSRISHHTFLE